MEVLMMNSGAAAQAVATEVFPTRSTMLGMMTHRVVLPRKARLGFDLDVGMRSRRTATMVRVVNSAVAEGKTARRAAVPDHPQLFVGLPLDAVSDCNTVNHAKAIAVGLKVLKLLGVDGVEVPVWWGVVEKKAMGKYDWSGYLALAQMIQEAGLKIHAKLYFNASLVPPIPLPSWVSSIGDADPDIYFVDKEGRRRKDCLSFAVDDLRVLGGKSPIQVYEVFCQSFQAAFDEFLGSTITDISIGLGPGGELKYPSHLPGKNQQTGVGQFQCYDKHMLANLQKHADDSGNHYWGLSGPHDAPLYDQSPNIGNFFKDNGGSWETPYGDFFLTWYSDHLLSHGDRILSMASTVFGTSPVTISAKIPLEHFWYNTRSHPSGLTAGYYNTDKRDGYDAVAKMFARNSCGMIVTGMELCDNDQPKALRSSPQSLVSQIKNSCKKHKVRVLGENFAITGVSDAFSKIKENVMGRESLMDSFSYQRMGASFFSPEHWPRFMEFVRSLSQLELEADDLLQDGERGITLTTDKVTGNSRQMVAV